MFRRSSRRPRNATRRLLATVTSCLACTRTALIVTSSVEFVVTVTLRLLPLPPLLLLLQPLLLSPPPLGASAPVNLPSVSIACFSVSLIIILSSPWGIILLLLSKAMLMMWLMMWLMLRARHRSSGGSSRERSMSGMGTKGHGRTWCLSEARIRRGQGSERPSKKRSQSIPSNGSAVGVTPARDASGLDRDDPGSGGAVSPALPAYPPREEIWVATMRARGPCTRPPIHLPRRVHPGHVHDHGRGERCRRLLPLLNVSV